MKRFMFLACLLLMPSAGWATTASIMGVADTGRVDSGKRMIAYPGSKVEISHLDADTLQSFHMVAGQRATTQYVASDTLRTDLITGLTDTNTGLSWLGPDSLALVAGGGNRLTVGATGAIYVDSLIVKSTQNGDNIKSTITIGSTVNYGRLSFSGAGAVAGVVSRSDAAAGMYFGEASDTGLYSFRGSGTFSVGKNLDVPGTGLISSRLAVGSTDTTQAHFYATRNVADALATGRFYQQNASSTGAALESSQASTSGSGIRVKGNGGGIVTHTVTIADGDSANLATVLNLSGKANGTIEITTSVAGYYKFQVRGGVNAVVELDDPAATGSITKGTGNSLNVYYSAVAGAYYVENLQGAAREMVIIFMGSGTNIN